MHISAIDLGFMYTKAKINGKRVIMKSVIGNSKPQRFSDLNMGLKNGVDHLQCRIGTDDYFVSDLAIDQSDTILHSLKDDRFDSTATEALVKTAFAMALGSDHVETKVVSGLPVSHYAAYKNNIQKLFMGDKYKIHNFDVKVHNQIIRGSAKVTEGQFIPQPFGALLDRVLDANGDIADKKLAGQTVAVIDPGFGTTDIYVADALSPVERLTFSTKTAMNHSYRLISNYIEEKFGVILPLHAIEKVVRTGEFRKSGKAYDLSQVIRVCNLNTAQQLVAEVTNKWKTIHEIDHILLAGGGGIALSPGILPEFPNIELLPDSQWSVVEGYYKWGVRQWRGKDNA